MRLHGPSYPPRSLVVLLLNVVPVHSKGKNTAILGLGARGAPHILREGEGVACTSQTQYTSLLQGQVQPITAISPPLKSTASSRSCCITYIRDTANMSTRGPSTAPNPSRPCCITYARDTVIMSRRGLSTTRQPPVEHKSSVVHSQPNPLPHLWISFILLFDVAEVAASESTVILHTLTQRKGPHQLKTSAATT